MNKGIEILLERMKSNPEEFEYRIDLDADRWTILFRDYESVLEPEDVEAYKSARRKMLQDKFTEAVMKELLDPKPLVNPYLVQPSATRLGGATHGLFTSGTAYANTATATLSASGNLTTNSITLGSTTLEEEHFKAMKALHKKPKRWWNKAIPELLGKK